MRELSPLMREHLAWVYGPRKPLSREEMERSAEEGAVWDACHPEPEWDPDE